jgi:hypothetical protein
MSDYTRQAIDIVSATIVLVVGAIIVYALIGVAVAIHMF